MPDSETMSRTHNSQVTHLLQAIDAGDPAARSALWEAIYDELRRIAIRYMKKENAACTLQPTALVHEAWVRLVGPKDGWSNRAHFFGAVAKVMRDILVENARKRSRLKRGGGRRRVDGDIVILQKPITERDPAEIMAVDEAIERLRKLSARQANVIECRYFAGMTTKETAEALGVSLRVVTADSSIAAAWLRRELSSSD